MGIISEKIEGEVISVTINSSNIKSASYNVSTETLTIEFNSGSKYEYYKVPHKVFTQFRMSSSQGKYFNTEISRVYKFTKL